MYAFSFLHTTQKMSFSIQNIFEIFVLDNLEKKLTPSIIFKLIKVSKKQEKNFGKIHQ